MNDELTNYLLAELKKGIEFSKIQLPEVAEQLLEYEFTSAVAWIIIGTLLLVACSFWFRYSCIKLKETSYDEHTPYIVGIMVSSLLLTIMAIAVPNNTFKAYKISTAPKYYLLSELRGCK